MRHVNRLLVSVTKKWEFLKITYRNRKIYQKPTDYENSSRVFSLNNILNTI